MRCGSISGHQPPGGCSQCADYQVGAGGSRGNDELGESGPAGLLEGADEETKEQLGTWRRELAGWLKAAGGLAGIGDVSSSLPEKRYSDRPFEYDSKPQRDERFPILTTWACMPRSSCMTSGSLRGQGADDVLQEDSGNRRAGDDGSHPL